MSDYESDKFSDIEVNESDEENEIYREIAAAADLESETNDASDTTEHVEENDENDENEEIEENDKNDENDEIEEVKKSTFIDVKTVSNYNNEIFIVDPNNRRTSNVINKYEMTDYVSIRAIQIAQYNNCIIDITGLDEPIKMAKRELMMRECPLVLRRYVGKLKNKTGEYVSYYEDWNVSEMVFSVAYDDVI